MTPTLYSALFEKDSRVSRYGDFNIVTFQVGAVVVPAAECQQVMLWTRTQPSRGNGSKNIVAFLDRIETALARNGCGLATKGNRASLGSLVKAMKSNGILLTNWNVPPNLDTSVEVVKKPKEDAKAKP